MIDRLSFPIPKSYFVWFTNVFFMIRCVKDKKSKNFGRNKLRTDANWFTDGACIGAFSVLIFLISWFRDDLQITISPRFSCLGLQVLDRQSFKTLLVNSNEQYFCSRFLKLPHLWAELFMCLWWFLLHLEMHTWRFLITFFVSPQINPTWPGLFEHI